jgi:hypothetical protein
MTAIFRAPAKKGKEMNDNRDRHHQPETVSTASLQTFEDPPGGLPLDSPIVQARQSQQRRKPGNQQPIENDPPPPGK